MSDPIMWKRIVNQGGPPHSQTWRHFSQLLLAIVSRDMGRWHMSVSHRDRVPTWGELGEARDALLPADLHFMVPHPPRRYWLNYDRRVLHLWEMRDREMAEQFVWEGEEAKRHGANVSDSGG